ncbi:MAG: hypothetical protein AVDCRST_MAG31-1880 [uncultured Sphingomonas sp.]|uniref:Lipoprotein n=1 Tax=uncultured Sphingomonas sp. TaxID=158754 RepID=A0A6J4TJR8_9SPHN|nr:hypothetical protein [uncultured Sphingomonas sp.]CAA9525391.1 MAG: hypothetical protein AVDCRST_MAG31-1880 [uncultured Sphingomonas sp.]
MLRTLPLIALAVAACTDRPVGAPPAENGAAPLNAAAPPASASQRPAAPAATGARADPALADETDPALQPPAVQPLARADFEGRIDSGLGCSFKSAGSQTLLVATAPMDSGARAQGVIKVGGKVELLRAGQPGGYAALAAGQSLANEMGWSAFVRRAPGTGRAEGAESTSWPASLIVAMEGGGSVTFENGRWSCGA